MCSLIQRKYVNVKCFLKWQNQGTNQGYPLFLQQGARDKVNVGIRAPYFRVCGIQVDTEGQGSTSGTAITPAEEEEFRRLAKSPNIYETIAKSVAPSIYGSLDIKKAISCLLFGGSRKRYDWNYVICYLEDKKIFRLQAKN